MLAEDDSMEESGEPQKPKKKLSTKQIIIVTSILLVLVGAGFLAYLKFVGGSKHAEEQTEEHVEEAAPEPKHEAKETSDKSHKAGEAPVLMELDSFVVNLSNGGRYMKLKLQMELVNKLVQKSVEERTPQIRDTIIILLTSKSVDDVNGADGKLQLKDEILVQVNYALGEDLVRKIYFTEFVVQ